MTSYRYTSEEIGELNRTIDRLRAEVERLRGLVDDREADLGRMWGETIAEVERLRAEVAEWKERWAAERHDHETTIRHFDTLMNEAL